LDAADTEDDVVLEQSLNAALAHLDLIVSYPDDSFTDALTEAVFLVTQRLAARRNSPEGIVGLSGIGGDFVGARVPFTDPDVMQLIAPYRQIPVA
jgi:hypothetical protein